MEIVAGYPPNYAEIKKKFKFNNQNVVFTYGDKVYVPNGKPLPDHLEVHESTHIKQQAEIGAEKWWERYLQDKNFRLEQEVEAYKNQYAFISQNYGRNDRKGFLKKISNDLSSEMYGGIVTRKEAVDLILT